MPRPWPLTTAWLVGAILIALAGAEAQNVLALFLGAIAWGLTCGLVGIAMGGRDAR